MIVNFGDLKKKIFNSFSKTFSRWTQVWSSGCKENGISWHQCTIPPYDWNTVVRQECWYFLKCVKEESGWWWKSLCARVKEKPGSAPCWLDADRWSARVPTFKNINVFCRWLLLLLLPRNYGLKAWLSGKPHRLGFQSPPPQKKCRKVRSLSSPQVNIWPRCVANPWRPPPRQPQPASSRASLSDQTWGTPGWASCWAACSSAAPPCSTWAWAASSAPQKATVTGGWSSPWARPITTSPSTNTFQKTRPSFSSAAFPGAAPRWCAWCWTPTSTCAAAKRLGWSPASWPCEPPGVARWRSECGWTRPASPTRCWTRRWGPSCWRWAAAAGTAPCWNAVPLVKPLLRVFQVIVGHGEPAPRLCNKDPFALKSLSYLCHIFPKAKFVLMLRDGRATVHSMISRKVGGAFTPTTAVEAHVSVRLLRWCGSSAFVHRSPSRALTWAATETVWASGAAPWRPCWSSAGLPGRTDVCPSATNT